MIVTLSFKTPDVMNQLEGEHQTEGVKEVIRKFVQWGEYVRIVFDTEKQTATVLPV